MDSAWIAHQVDALEGAGFKPFTAEDGETLYAWQYDELHGEIADTPVWVQNTIIMLDEETRSVDLFVMDSEAEAFTPRTVEDIPGWGEWVGDDTVPEDTDTEWRAIWSEWAANMEAD